MLRFFSDDRFRFWAPILLVTGIFIAILIALFLTFFKSSDDDIQTVNQKDDGEVIVDTISIPNDLPPEQLSKTIDALLLEDPSSSISVIYSPDSEITPLSVTAEGSYVVSMLVPSSFDPVFNGENPPRYVFLDREGNELSSGEWNSLFTSRPTSVTYDDITYSVWDTTTPVFLRPDSTFSFTAPITPGSEITSLSVTAEGSYVVSMLVPSSFDPVFNGENPPRYVFLDREGNELSSGEWNSLFTSRPTSVTYDDITYSVWDTTTPVFLRPDSTFSFTAPGVTPTIPIIPTIAPISPTAPGVTPTIPIIPTIAPISPTAPGVTPTIPIIPTIAPISPTAPGVTPTIPIIPTIAPISPTAPGVTPTIPIIPTIAPISPTAPGVTPTIPIIPTIAPISPTAPGVTPTIPSISPNPFISPRDFPGIVLPDLSVPNINPPPPVNIRPFDPDDPDPDDPDPDDPDPDDPDPDDPEDSSILRVKDSISSQRVVINESKLVEINNAFIGGTGSVRYTVASNNPTTASASISGSTIRLTGHRLGRTLVRVVASDGRSSANQTFSVSVTSEREDSDGVIESLIAAVLGAAVATVAICLANAAVASLLPFWVSTQDGGNLVKECALDQIAFRAVKRAAVELASSYIDWALSGFHGTPLFLSHPGQFWRNFTDRAIGHALDDAGLGFLCEGGLEIDISALLELRYSRFKIEPPSCTLSEILENDFISDARNAVDDITNLRIVSLRETENIINFGNPVSQIAAIDTKIDQIKLEIGPLPSVRDLISGDDESKIASFQEDCFGVRDPVDCQVYTSPQDIAHRKNQLDDLQLDSLTTADEFGEDLIALAIKATVVGLIRRGLQEGLQGFNVSSYARDTEILFDPTINLPGGGSLPPKKLFSYLFYTGNSSSEYGSQVYRKIFRRKVLLQDTRNLLSFMQSNLYQESTPPSGYTPRNPSPDSYKRYGGQLDSGLINYSSLSKTPVGDFLVNYFSEEVQRSRSISFNDCRHSGAHPESCDVSITLSAFIFPKDLITLQKLNSSAGSRARNKESRYMSTVISLESIYEATVSAHANIAGEEKDYQSRADGSFPELNLFQQRIKNEAPDRRLPLLLLARNKVKTKFQNNSAEVFVPFNYVHRNGRDTNLTGCQKETNSDKLLIRGGVIDNLVQTTCTLNRFEEIVDTRLQIINTRDAGELVYTLYALAHSSKLIQLPKDSSIDILENSSIHNFSLNTELSNRYAAFGQILYGTNDSRAREVHLGALSAGEAEDAYLSSFAEKITLLYKQHIQNLITSSS